MMFPNFTTHSIQVLKVNDFLPESGRESFGLYFIDGGINFSRQN